MCYGRLFVLTTTSPQYYYLQLVARNSDKSATGLIHNCKHTIPDRLFYLLLTYLNNGLAQRWNALYVREIIIAIFFLYSIHIDIGYECIVFSCVIKINLHIISYMPD